MIARELRRTGDEVGVGLAVQGQRAARRGRFAAPARARVPGFGRETPALGSWCLSGQNPEHALATEYPQSIRASRVSTLHERGDLLELAPEQLR